MTKFLKFTTPALALLGLALGSCQPEIDEPSAPTAGSATFTTYLAVGNSLTAGYQSNGLSREGQLNSYPNILAKQFAQVGGGAFTQPLFSEAQANGSGYLALTAITAAGTPVLTPVTTNLAVVPGSTSTGTNLLARFSSTTPNQNLGVPGIRIADVTTAGYGYNNPLGYNPFFERLLSGTLPSGGASYLQYVQGQVAAVKPTFFTNWLGNNDVLGYASSGGAAAPLTPVADFTTKYKQVLDALTSGGAKGLLATIPNVTNVPFFTTVTTDLVNASIRTSAPSASLYIRTGAGTTRAATSNDLILLTAQQVIGTPTAGSLFPVGVGISAAASNPLPSQYVLDEAEVQAAVARTNELNTVIRTEASNRSLALFDSNNFFTTVAASGFATNGVQNTTAFIRGNLFSLDGVHPTSRGYAVVANQMIEAINSKYGSSLRQVDANQYPGTLLPR